MKLLKSASLILMAFFMLSLTQSCSNKKIEDEQLTGFMLGGIYFIHGFGGIDNVNRMMASSGYKSNEDLAKGYKKLLEFPFRNNAQERTSCRSTLKNYWDITDKASLLETLESLKTKEFNHKAWDYARIVNNVCMGYGAGYITKDEGIKIVNELLPLAREKYANWEEYYTDYNLGRADWDPDSKNDPFEKLSKEITKGEKSIYNILPLK